MPVSLWEAGAHLSALDLVARFTAPPGFDTGPSLPGRLRGALGRALRQRSPSPALARRMSLFDIPDAAQALFMATDMGRPYTLFVETQGRDIRLILRLFGRASVWSCDIEAALAAALADGIGIAPLSRVKARFSDITIARQTYTLPPTLPSAPCWRLITRSPISLERRDAQAPDAAAIIGSLFARAQNAMAWCGYAMQIEPGRLATLQTRGAIVDWSLYPESWPRYSNRQGQRVEMLGLSGAATLALDEPEIPVLTTLASCTGIGSHTTFGLGRIDLLPVSM